MSDVLKQWEKRVIAFQMIYVYIVRDNQELDFASKYENVDDDVLKIVDYAIKNLDDIKQEIQPYIKQGWTWNRLLNVDKAILVEAVAEKATFDTDKNIIIDQAVVTAKNYSDESSYKFINYILDKIL